MNCCHKAFFLALFLSVISLIGSTQLNLATLPDLIGTDSYLRFLLIEKLELGHGWYDRTLQETNWPHGLEIHWTRPLDILLYPFVTLMPPMIGALIYQFLLTLAFLWGLIKIAHHWGANFENLILPVLVLVTFSNPFLLTYFAPARIDHHAILATLMVWLLYALTKHRYISAGIIAGLALWVSVEFFAPLFFISLGLGLYWLRDSTRSPYLLSRFFVPATLLCAIAILVERPPEQFTHSLLDSLSYSHLGLLLLTSVAALSIERFPYLRLSHRFTLAALAILFIAGTSLSLMPELTSSGFLAIQDPMIAEYFAQGVGELKNALETGYQFGPFYPILIALMVAIPVLQAEKWPRFPTLLLLTALGLNLLFLTAFRWVYYAIPTALLLFAYSASHPLWEARKTIRALFIAVLAIGPLANLILTKSQQIPDPAASRCEVELSHLIRTNALGDEPLTLALTADRGYETLFFTPHRILASNNHRNEAGLRDLLQALHASSPEEARRTITQRNVDMIITCSHHLKPESYLHQSQPWLLPHPLTNTFQQLKIWQVTKSVLTAHHKQ